VIRYLVQVLSNSDYWGATTL